jgi:high affinity Mn2+ porin
MTAVPCTRFRRAGASVVATLCAWPAWTVAQTGPPPTPLPDWRQLAVFSEDDISAPPAAADQKNLAVPDQPPAHWSVHFQDTFVLQGVPGFHSPYQISTSLTPNQLRETNSDTLFLAYCPWQGGSVVVDPEYSQGIGLSHSYGAAGFPNGEAQRASDIQGKIDISRIYIRQVFGLGGEIEPVADAENQLAGPQDVSRFVVQFGKFALPDNIDDNTYSHDDRTQFLNWSIFESGAWDFPADSKGYTYGLYLEFNQKSYTLRFATAQVPRVPDGLALDNQFWRRFGDVLELETRFQINGHPGKLRTLGFLNKTNSATYQDLVDHPGADPLRLRADRLKYGGAVTGEQELVADLGAFFRLSINDGQTQSWSFTDIDRTAAIGLSLKGSRWSRPDDTVGLAGAINGITREHQEFFAAGGIGLTIGDGQLPHYATENILEFYYDARLPNIAIPRLGPLTTNLAFDYQLIGHPAYNADRGPASVLGARLHLEY